MDLPPHLSLLNGKVPRFITVKDRMMLSIPSVPVSATGSSLLLVPLLYLFCLFDIFRPPFKSFLLHRKMCSLRPASESSALFSHTCSAFLETPCVVSGNLPSILYWGWIMGFQTPKLTVPTRVKTKPSLLCSIHRKAESAPLRNSYAWTWCPAFTTKPMALVGWQALHF